jgi:transposase
MSDIKRTVYPLEFKISSVKLAIESDQPIAQTARDLGINANTIHNWIAKYSNSSKNHMTNNESTSEENRRLKKELAMVKQERDLLKKAAAYFARESR